MAKLADLLRAGYVSPKESALADPIKEHFRSLPQKFEENQRAQMDLLARVYPGDTYKSMMLEGDPAAMSELAMQAPLLGSTAIYHGTSPEAAMNIAKRGFNTKKSADGTIWFTTNPEIGEVAATGKGAVIKRLLDEDKLKLATPEQADKYFIDQLISEGYKGVKYPSYGSKEATHYQIFDPKILTKEKISRKELIEQELKKSVE